MRRDFVQIQIHVQHVLRAGLVTILHTPFRRCGGFLVDLLPVCVVARDAYIPVPFYAKRDYGSNIGHTF